MAPQGQIPAAANVLGTIGTVCWCVQLVPQVWYNWRQKKTDGLPGLMLFLWAACAVPFGVYAVVQNFNIPIQVQPQAFGVLALICWAQCLIYHDKWRVWTASLLAAGCGILFGGVEALLILTLRGPYARGVEWPIIMIGAIAAVLLAAGLVPPYFEIWKRKGRVVGINFIFLAIDWSGAFFSLMALVAQHTFDILGGVLYIVCLFLELGIFISHVVWLIRTRRVRKEAKLAGRTYDEYVDDEEGVTRERPGAGDMLGERPASGVEAGDEDDVEKGGVVAAAIDRVVDGPEETSVEHARKDTKSHA
ncbi:PQ loop repeat-domain-containing protein [Cryomyces antarcticus]